MSIITPALSKTELENKKFWEKQNKHNRSNSPDLDWEQEQTRLQHEKERMQDLGIDPKGQHSSINPKIVEHIKAQLIKDPNTTTVRADGGKPSVDLLPPKALLLMAQVLTKGADKYGRVNWQAGMAWSRCYASCLRHLFSWWSGETNDPETGLNHLAHAACNILFLLEYTDKNTGTDDRIYNGSV